MVINKTYDIDPEEVIATASESLPVKNPNPIL